MASTTNLDRWLDCAPVVTKEMQHIRILLALTVIVLIAIALRVPALSIVIIVLSHCLFLLVYCLFLYRSVFWRCSLESPGVAPNWGRLHVVVRDLCRVVSASLKSFEKAASVEGEEGSRGGMMGGCWWG